MKIFIYMNAALVAFFASVMVIESIGNLSADPGIRRIQMLLLGALLCWIIASVVAAYHA